MKTLQYPVLFLLAALVVAPLPLTAATPPATSGKVVFADGEVTANGRTIDTGDLLTGSVILKTGQASVLEVVFGERNVFRLGANTVVQVDFSVLKKTVTLEKGVFTSVLKKLGQLAGEPSFVLRAPTVNAGIRGTSFHVETDGEKTYFCTCNGSVTLDDGTPADLVDLTNAHHGARLFTKQPDGTITVTTAGLEGHTDASIVSLASRIGVSVDWTKPDLKHE